MRFIVKNSHYIYREAKQMEKLVLDMATRFFSSPVRHLFVALLNKGNKEVRKAHKSYSANLSLLGSATLTSPLLSPNPPPASLKPLPASLMPQTPLLNPQKRHAPDRYGGFQDGRSSNKTEMEEDKDTKDSENDRDEKEDAYIDKDRKEVSDKELEESLNEELDGETSVRGDGLEGESEHGSDVDKEYKMVKKVKEEFKKMSTVAQKAFDQEQWNLRRLLALDPKKTYKVTDLENDCILGWGLRLLYLSRFGRDWLYTRISPHI